MDFLGVNAQLLGGFKYTLLIFFITLIAAIPLGLPIALGSMSRFKPLRWISRAFVWVLRGTPLMLQIMVVSMRRVRFSDSQRPRPSSK